MIANLQKVPQTLVKWPSDGVRRASVNSLGYGGTNAHIILENLGNLSKNASSTVTNGQSQNGFYQNGHHHNGTVQGVVHENDHQRNGIEVKVAHQNGYELKLKRLHVIQQSQQSLVFQLSAKHEEAAQQMKANLSTYLSDRHDVDEGSLLANLAYTLGQRRSALSWSQSMPATSVSGLIEALNDKKAKPSRSSKVPRLGFVFTGQGAQWAQMGRELIAAYPVFKDSIDRADEYLMTLGCPWSLRGKNRVRYRGLIANTCR